MDKSNFCTYCSAVFGTMVLYKGKLHILFCQKKHFTPISKNGLDEDINITPACQICNMVKFTKDFATGTEAQLFILDKLLKSDWRIVRGPGEGLPPTPRHEASESQSLVTEAPTKRRGVPAGDDGPLRGKPFSGSRNIRRKNRG